MAVSSLFIEMYDKTAETYDGTENLILSVLVSFFCLASCYTKMEYANADFLIEKKFRQL